MSVGIMGGMGPMASAYLYELMIQMTKADTDQDHLEVVMISDPTIPDRTAYILGQSPDSPLPRMLAVGKQLEMMNVDCIAIPCMTAHYFHRELSALQVPVIHGIRQTAETLWSAGVTRVGIMATDGTVQSGIFQQEIEALGMEAILPTPVYQGQIMKMIYEDVKAGGLPTLEEFFQVKNHLMRGQGAQAVVLGCTELSLIKKAYDLGMGVIDSLEVLAKSAVLLGGKTVKPEYEELIKCSRPMY